MSNNDSSNKAHRLSIVGRLTENMLNRQLGRFAAELTLIVAGVLIALAIDGAVSDARDRKAEVTYLELLSRDMTEIKVRVASQIEFEKHQIRVATDAYDALSKTDPAAHRKQLEISLVD